MNRCRLETGCAWLPDVKKCCNECRKKKQACSKACDKQCEEVKNNGK